MDNNSVAFFDKYIKGRINEIYDYQPVIAESGDFKRLEGINSIINQVRNLLLTPLGHYPFDPEYGSLLYQQIFEMADETTINAIKYECKQRVEMYVPKISVEDVSVTPFSNGKGFKVDVQINREGVKGKVSLVLPSQNNMFGLEDIDYQRQR